MVTCVDKANVFRSLAFFRKVFYEVADRHSDIAVESCYIDAMSLYMVQAPWNYDVLVMENMFGDMLSDLRGKATTTQVGDAILKVVESGSDIPPFLLESLFSLDKKYAIYYQFL